MYRHRQRPRQRDHLELHRRRNPLAHHPQERCHLGRYHLVCHRQPIG